MNEHLRMDGIKVFEEDAKRLLLVMQDHQIKNKSEAWRIALRDYEKNRHVSHAIDSLKDELASVSAELAKLSSAVEDLYFIVQHMSREPSP